MVVTGSVDQVTLSSPETLQYSIKTPVAAPPMGLEAMIDPENVSYAGLQSPGDAGNGSYEGLQSPADADEFLELLGHSETEASPEDIPIVNSSGPAVAHDPTESTVAGSKLFDDYLSSGTNLNIDEYLKQQSGDDFLSSLGIDAAIKSYNEEERLEEEKKLQEAAKIN
ncbi:hypothetical protein FOA43_001758 [Brettanomyces nanus]|uniref:Uncharacterized protein n=1 Tax=Eeniella nana TaxID=13502 RepID=A0A875S3S6_EENNA|nr:uncharacterized protein FOA43_001758 [Brettanomyces nanus]QPG74429.1 hypothetical protein FOA43_001758 [Brettanomyces nanus]